MPLPQSPRVVYQTNPLEEVICQLTFPPVLRIDTEPPAAFQEQIRNQYPLFQDNPPSLINLLELPPDLAKLIGTQIPALGPNKLYQFSSADEVWKIGLTRDFLSLSTRSYTRWENFKLRMQPIFNALVEQYAPAFFLRIGLRYRDVIRRSGLRLIEVEWSELLQPHLLGELSSAEVRPDVKHAAREVVISLQDEGTQVRVRHGLARTGANGETCYVIDADFFKNQRTEVEHAFNILDSFNRQAGRLFRWYITDRLHEALGPTIID